MRLLYGGRNSLEIGGVATLITMILATLIGVAAGYFRGWVDGVLGRVLDLLWAYPVVILGRRARRHAGASAASTSGSSSSRATR